MLGCQALCTTIKACKCSFRASGACLGAVECKLCKDLHKLWAQGTSQVPFAVTACLAHDGMQTYSHTAAVQVFMQLQTRSTAVSHCEARVLLHNQNIWPLNWSKKNFFKVVRDNFMQKPKTQPDRQQDQIPSRFVSFHG